MDDHCSVVSHRAAAPLSTNRARRVPAAAAADDDDAAAKVCSPAGLTSGTATSSSYRTASILSDTLLQPAPCSPSLRHRSPRISAHGACFPPRSRPATSPISGFPLGPIDWLIKGGAGAADRTTVAVKSIAPRRGLGDKEGGKCHPADNSRLHALSHTSAYTLTPL